MFTKERLYTHGAIEPHLGFFPGKSHGSGRIQARRAFRSSSWVLSAVALACSRASAATPGLACIASTLSLAALADAVAAPSCFVILSTCRLRARHCATPTPKRSAVNQVTG